MKNRLEEMTRKAVAKKEKLFCAFLTLGFPNIKTTESLIEGLEKQGVDIVELGFPFSDPMADGPTIQYASEQALKKGVGMRDAFEVVRRVRKKGVEVPIVFFTYFNPVLHYGIEKFSRDAARAGFDAVLIPDLPPDAEECLQKVANREGLSQVYLVAPTTEPRRAREIVSKSQGFIYYVSLRGVTGARKALPADVSRHLRELKGYTSKPILVGFGVSSPEQARNLSRMSQGVIVGSALIDQIRKSGGRQAPVLQFVRKMVRAAKGS